MLLSVLGALNSLIYDMATWRHGDMATWRHGDMATWRRIAEMECWIYTKVDLTQKSLIINLAPEETKHLFGPSPASGVRLGIGGNVRLGLKLYDAGDSINSYLLTIKSDKSGRAVVDWTFVGFQINYPSKPFSPKVYYTDGPPRILTRPFVEANIIEEPNPKRRRPKDGPSPQLNAYFDQPSPVGPANSLQPEITAAADQVNDLNSIELEASLHDPGINDLTLDQELWEAGQKLNRILAKHPEYGVETDDQNRSIKFFKTETIRRPIVRP